MSGKRRAGCIYLLEINIVRQLWEISKQLRITDDLFEHIICKHAIDIKCDSVIDSINFTSARATAQA